MKKFMSLFSSFSLIILALFAFSGCSNNEIGKITTITSYSQFIPADTYSMDPLEHTEVYGIIGFKLNEDILFESIESNGYDSGVWLDRPTDTFGIIKNLESQTLFLLPKGDTIFTEFTFSIYANDDTLHNRYSAISRSVTYTIKGKLLRSQKLFYHDELYGNGTAHTDKIFSIDIKVS